jgi:hypothetical protein
MIHKIELSQNEIHAAITEYMQQRDRNAVEIRLNSVVNTGLMSSQQLPYGTTTYHYSALVTVKDDKLRM